MSVNTRGTKKCDVIDAAYAVRDCPIIQICPDPPNTPKSVHDQKNQCTRSSSVPRRDSIMVIHSSKLIFTPCDKLVGCHPAC